MNTVLKIENLQPMKKALLPYVASGTVLMTKESASSSIEDELEEENSSPTTSALFHCPNSFCSSEYIRYSRLQDHIISGICKVRQLTTNTADFGKEAIKVLRFIWNFILPFISLVKTIYISKFGLSSKEAAVSKDQLKSALFDMNLLPTVEIDPELGRHDVPLAKVSEPWYSITSEGHALIYTKPRRKYTKKQTEYIKQIFDDGQKSKKKARPLEVSKAMRVERVKNQDGSDSTVYIFTCDE